MLNIGIAIIKVQQRDRFELQNLCKFRSTEGSRIVLSSSVINNYFLNKLIGYQNEKQYW